MTAFPNPRFTTHHPSTPVSANFFVSTRPAFLVQSPPPSILHPNTVSNPSPSALIAPYSIRYPTSQRPRKQPSIDPIPHPSPNYDDFIGWRPHIAGLHLTSSLCDASPFPLRLAASSPPPSAATNHHNETAHPARYLKFSEKQSMTVDKSTNYCERWCAGISRARPYMMRIYLLRTAEVSVSLDNAGNSRGVRNAVIIGRVTVAG